MTAASFWFGPPDRPLFGHLHVPAGGCARGGVVICPTIGIEASYAEHSLRLLARQLADAGLLALRFDYDGAGQSAGGLTDPDRLTAWLASIGHAVSLVRAAGATWVGGVGFRLGATLAANPDSAGDGLDALVLWDPYASGTAFLREQRLLQLGVVPPVEGGSPGLAAPGYVYPEETVAELGTLEFTAPEGLPPRVLVLTDPGRPHAMLPPEVLRGRDGIERQNYAAADDLLDTGVLTWEPPRPVIRQVAGWLSRACDHDATPVLLPASARTTVVLGGAADGHRGVVESVLRIEPAGLFGVSCRPSSPVDRSDARPTVLFLGMAAESSAGPARQWVELARRLAGGGYPSLRLDFSGIAESPARPGQPERLLYSPGVVRDVEDAVRAVSPDDPGNVVLVGVCSGAGAALLAASRIRPRAAVSVNPNLNVRLDGRAAGIPPDAGPRGPRGRAAAAATSLATLGRGTSWRRRLGRRRRWLREQLPFGAWRLIYVLRPADASHARALGRVCDAGVPLLLICGTREADIVRRRALDVLRRLEEPSRFVELPDLNHSLLHAANRRDVGDLLLDYLRTLSPDLRPREDDRDREPVLVADADGELSQSPARRESSRTPRQP